MIAPRFSRQDLTLVGITILWGATFLLIRFAMEAGGAPLSFVGLRFFVAGLILAAVFHKSLRGVTKIDVIAGLAIGASIAAGAGLQTAALQTITSSQSAFITALYVPLVPLMQWAILRKAPHPMAWLGAALAFTGLVFLAGGPQAIRMGLSFGEIATLLSAFAFAGEILLISYFAARSDTRRVTILQLLGAGAFAALMGRIGGEDLTAIEPMWLICALTLALMSSLIQFAMNWAQRSVSPTRATIIYAGEPVWGGLFGRLAGERLAPIALLGALFILAGVLVSELRLTRKKQA